jgi:hypothetical protein
MGRPKGALSHHIWRCLFIVFIKILYRNCCKTAFKIKGKGAWEQGKNHFGLGLVESFGG